MATRLIEFKKKNYEKLSRLLLGNESAIEFISMAFVSFHILDDLIDKDTALSDEDICKAFWGMLIDLPVNPFYINNFASIRPMIINAYVNWETANQYERDNDNLHTAFIIRSAYIDILSLCVFIVGGLDWALECAFEIKHWAHSETFEGYLTNLEAEQKLREV